MKITIYSTTTCPYCKSLKDYLTGKNIPFDEKEIDQDDSAREEMLKVSEGFQGVPFVVVENEGKVDTVMGFDKGKLDSLLNLT